VPTRAFLLSCLMTSASLTALAPRPEDCASRQLLLFHRLTPFRGETPLVKTGGEMRNKQKSYTRSCMHFMISGIVND